MTTEKALLEFTPGSVKKAMAGVTSSDLWKMPRDRIVVQPGFNVRVHDAAYKAHVRWIADSIKANGFDPAKALAGYVASTDNGDTFILTAGPTRLEAFDRAVAEGWEGTELPVVTKPRGTSMEDLTVALVTANNGRPLSPYEIATVCKRLIGYGMEPKDIASRLGFTKQYIDGLLDLMAAPKAVRDLVIAGTVSATLAVETVKKHGAEASKVLKASAAEATASGKERVTKKHVVKATKAPAKKAKKKAATGVVDTQVQQLEAAGKWFFNSGYGDDMKDILVSFTATMMGLKKADVETYFEDDL